MRSYVVAVKVKAFTAVERREKNLLTDPGSEHSVV